MQTAWRDATELILGSQGARVSGGPSLRIRLTTTTGGGQEKPTCVLTPAVSQGGGQDESDLVKALDQAALYDLLTSTNCDLDLEHGLGGVNARGRPQREGASALSGPKFGRFAISLRHGRSVLGVGRDSVAPAQMLARRPILRAASRIGHPNPSPERPSRCGIPDDPLS